MPIPSVGSKAPDFQLPDHTGKTVSLSQLAGKNVVLYFYPKDDTPGCTREACNFRDEHSALTKAGAVVLGVSPDGATSHQKFATKYSLPFPLLSDTEHKVADAYGVWGEKSLYGRKFIGLTRATFLIDAQGQVKQVWPKVKVDGHVAQVLSALTGGAPAAPVKKAAKKAANVVKAAAKKVVKKVAKKAPARGAAKTSSR
ncbi:MAG TPA: thioredoxin-dependent thiol peroxidase [Myxococcaceae bacterium]|nr:thioredoxin-dependent thiol peroxidase [Myxococcaceae bacterium]